MKKIIFITGLVSVNIMLLGALLKAFHLSGAAITLAFSILLFCLGFLPLALISSYNSQKERMYKWLYIVTFIVFTFDLVGALFKIVHWPYASLFLLIGVPLPFVLFLPVYLYQTYKFKDKSVLNHLGIMFGLTFLAVFSVFLALNVSANVLESFAMNSVNNENSAKHYQCVNENSSNKDAIKQKSDELCSYIDNLKYEILIATDNNQFANNKLENYNPINTINRTSTYLPIFSANNNNQSKIDILMRMVGEYRAMISQSKMVNPELKQLSNELFDVNDKSIQRNSEVLTLNWQDREFPGANLIIVLDVLSKVQSNVRFVEAEYLSGL